MTLAAGTLRRAAASWSPARLGWYAVSLFLLTRVATFVAVLVAARSSGRPVLDLLTKADGLEYLAIATQGYEPVPALGADGTYVSTPNLVFFPLYPATIKAFAWAVDPRVAALVATLVAGCVAAWLMAQWARQGAGPLGAVVAVGIWTLWPSSVVLSMAYSEALFSACVAGCLLAMQRGRWVWAAVACALAGLTRPTGAALLAALVVGLIVARAGWVRSILVSALGALGLVVSLGHVAIATGRLDGWFWMQSTVWRSGFDGGASLRRIMAEVVTGGRAAEVPPYVVTTVTAVLGVALVVVMLVGRVPAREAVYAVLATVMGLGGANYAHCKPRFLLVALPLFVVPGRWLSRLPAWALVALGVGLLALSVRWSVYLLATWPYSV